MRLIRFRKTLSIFLERKKIVWIFERKKKENEIKMINLMPKQW